MANYHIDETNIVDYVLGNLTHDEKGVIEYHLGHCLQCTRKAHYWKKVIETDRSFTPSAQLDEKIRSIPKRHKSSKKVTILNKKVYVMSSIVATILIVFVMNKLLFSNEPINDEQMNNGFIIAQQDEVPELDFLLEPAMNRQYIESLANGDINGELWLNEETNEIMFLAHGLKPLETGDYQLWIVHADDNWNGQLLHLREGSVRVYYKAPNIKLLKYLKVSVEPQGGSLTPTGPEILSIDFEE